MNLSLDPHDFVDCLMPSDHRLLSVIMPVYNEARTLKTITARVLSSPLNLPIELIAIDDCSTDGSYQLLQTLAAADPRIKVLHHPVNQGKGACIRTAIPQLTGTIALIQDADLEYDPRDYPALLAPILEDKADAVFGSRFISAPQRRVLLYWHSVANHFLTWVANVLNDVNLTDMATCYKVVRTDILKQIPLHSTRFNIEEELTTRLAQWNIRLYEVPVSYHGRSHIEGKKVRWHDAVSALWSLFKFRFLDTRFTTHDGYYILQSVRRAARFNRWMLSQFASFLGDRVVEAGCGIGNFTDLLLDKQRLICLDFDPFYIEMAQRRFGHLDNIRIFQADLTTPEAYTQLRAENPGTIICLNVLEHLEADEFVLRQYFDTLSPGGHAIIAVPAHPWLYSKCDAALGHCRRYTRDSLSQKMRAAGFEIVANREFNRLGVLGWIANKLLGNPKITPRQMRIYERLLPVAKLLDTLHLGPGLSVITIGRKPHSTALVPPPAA